MWDDAALLRSIANTLYMLCALMVMYGAVHYVMHMPTLLPLQSVRLKEKPQRVMASNVMRVVREDVRGNLFTADIEQVRASLEALPWVRKVSIRREFPNSLVVDLEEHQALARWNGSMLVNKFGEVFVAETEEALPEFQGPDGAAAEVAAHYEQFTSQLAAVDMGMSKLTLSARHAWQLSLSNGVMLELGREEMQQRLERFTQVYSYSLATRMGKLKYVDMRYRNGFAVGGLAGQG
jgi:cell division protein FtsQ